MKIIVSTFWTRCINRKKQTVNVVPGIWTGGHRMLASLDYCDSVCLYVPSICFIVYLGRCDSLYIISPFLWVLLLYFYTWTPSFFTYVWPLSLFMPKHSVNIYLPLGTKHCLYILGFFHSYQIFAFKIKYFDLSLKVIDSVNQKIFRDLHFSK